MIVSDRRMRFCSWREKSKWGPGKRPADVAQRGVSCRDGSTGPAFCRGGLHPLGSTFHIFDWHQVQVAAGPCLCCPAFLRHRA